MSPSKQSPPSTTDLCLHCLICLCDRFVVVICDGGRDVVFGGDYLSIYVCMCVWSHTHTYTQAKRRFAVSKLQRNTETAESLFKKGSNFRTGSSGSAAIVWRATNNNNRAPSDHLQPQKPQPQQQQVRQRQGCWLIVTIHSSRHR